MAKKKRKKQQSKKANPGGAEAAEELLALEAIYPGDAGRMPQLGVLCPATDEVISLVAALQEVCTVCAAQCTALAQ